MKVLLTGATGLVGSALTNALLDRGDAVAGLTRNPDTASARDPRVQWHRWDPAEGQPPPPALVGIDAIVHLMGEHLDQRWTDEVKQKIMFSRRDTTAMLAQAVSRLSDKPSVVVSASAVGYYGDRGADPLDESSAAGGDEAVSPNAFDVKVTAEWERAADGFENLGIRLVKLRSGHVLSPDGGFLARQLLPFKFGVGGPIAGGAQYVSWVHIADEIGLILWCLDNDGISGPVNATAPEPVTNREFASALGATLRRPAIMPIPKLALAALFGEEFAATMAGGQRALPQKAMDSGYRFEHPHLREALGDLLGR